MLGQLQFNLKSDPESFIDEFRQQHRHFLANYEIFSDGVKDKKKKQSIYRTCSLYE